MKLSEQISEWSKANLGEDYVDVRIVIVFADMVSQLEADNEALEDKERRAWEYARFFSGRSELLRLHIRTHLGLSQKDCIAWGEHDYRDALVSRNTGE